MTAKFLNDTGINPVLEESRKKERRTEKAQNKNTFRLNENIWGFQQYTLISDVDIFRSHTQPMSS